MAVTSKTSAQDPIGKALDADIAAAQAVVNGLSPKVTAQAQSYEVALRKLTQMQADAVNYYMSIGRISAATILSTLS
jgi:hypothetical protein